jgi:tetratricopeptide (TPR) repeat protein
MTEKAPKGREINHILMKQLQASDTFQHSIDETYNDFYLSEGDSVYIARALYSENNINQAMQKQKEANEEREKAERLAQQGKMQEAQAAKKKAEELIKQAMKLLGVDPEDEESEGEGKGVASAMMKASGGMEEMEGTLRSWGFDKSPASPTEQAMTAEIMKMAQRDHGKIARLAGKVEGIGVKARRGNKGYEPVDAKLTQDIEDIFPEGIEAMTGILGRAERFRALNDYLNDGLLGVDYDKQMGDGYGPFIGYGDESGSTNGSIDAHIKSILLGLAMLAQREGRQFEIYGFSGNVNTGRCIKPENSKLDFMKWASTHDGGGTDFDSVIRDATERIAKFYDGETEMYGADVILATDGESGISTKTAKSWCDLAKRTGARLHVLIVEDSGASKNEQAMALLKKNTETVFQEVFPASISYISSSFADAETIAIVSEMANSML